VNPRKQRGHKPPERKITILMHTIEYTGATPDPWLVRTDDGTEWHAVSELEAVAGLAEFILQRHQAEQALSALPDGAVLI
jgi:hypothetical protein